MSTRSIVRAFAVGAIVGALSLAPLAAQEKKQAPAMSPEEKAMMEKWNAYMTPGEEHKVLAQRAGQWVVKVTMWPAPGAPPQVSEGTSESRMILGGRYLEDVTSGSFNGMPFEGRGVTGYDNLKKKFVYSWIDNMGTGVMAGEGSYDPSARKFTYVSEAPDLIAGKTKKVRGVETLIDADHWQSVMFDRTPDGKEFKAMELSYSRKK